MTKCTVEISVQMECASSVQLLKVTIAFLRGLSPESIMIAVEPASGPKRLNALSLPPVA